MRLMDTDEVFIRSAARCTHFGLAGEREKHLWEVPFKAFGVPFSVFVFFVKR